MTGMACSAEGEAFAGRWLADDGAGRMEETRPEETRLS